MSESSEPKTTDKMVNESECETKAEESVALNVKDVEELALDFGYYETTIDVEEGVANPELPAKFTIFGYRPSQIKWSNVIFLSVMHVLAVYAYLHSCFNPVHLFTLFFVIFISSFSGFGMSVGGHRYWSHRTFKARLPLQIILAILQTMTVNGSILSYSRDHRNHHKWPATHADPKNPGRGFFFAHIGWWLLKKRPEVMLYGKKVPVDDLINDPIVYYQHKFYIPLVILLAYVFPTLVPVLSWKEDILTAFLVCSCLRTVVVLHHLFTVNSVAHFLGHRFVNQLISC
jgi:stearoyl-CoA desaturase (delta-9 desaturase)